MTYYLLLKNDTEEDVYFDSNVLGEESFEVFYPEKGFIALKNIVHNQPELLESLQILDDHKKQYTITEFLDKVEQWKIKR
mgnify:CR=1 FL=1|jgi:hypothetical protein|tara:strand:+ start:440 stop:679 length:240 start_codon:yes stop_codon:yes gene_type:complete